MSLPQKHNSLQVMTRNYYPRPALVQEHCLRHRRTCPRATTTAVFACLLLLNTLSVGRAPPCSFAVVNQVNASLTIWSYNGDDDSCGLPYGVYKLDANNGSAFLLRDTWACGLLLCAALPYPTALTECFSLFSHTNDRRRRSSSFFSLYISLFHSRGGELQQRKRVPGPAVLTGAGVRRLGADPVRQRTVASRRPERGHRVLPRRERGHLLPVRYRRYERQRRP
jgi:hypothetical protein